MRPFAGLVAACYGVIAADPPWAFKVRSSPPLAPHQRGADQHYRTMSLEDIKSLPVAGLAAPTGCHLFLWTTSPHLPQALDVIKAWGFAYSGFGFVWVKMGRGVEFAHRPAMGEHNLHVGMGYTTRKNVEVCLLARRGDARRLAKDVREVILAPVRQHSRKPEEAYARIERYGAGPYLEMFARERRAGWTSWGLQVDKFSA